MVRKYVVPLLAVVGVAFVIWTAVTSSKPIPAAPPVAQPSQAPFVSYVVGSGIIEANTQNIAVGTHVSGVVTEIFVKVGDTVKAGDPLFKLKEAHYDVATGVCGPVAVGRHQRMHGRTERSPTTGGGSRHVERGAAKCG
jgi:multidrug efflux pump subunit AcrA (membrane-fusion protein)